MDGKSIFGLKLCRSLLILVHRRGGISPAPPSDRSLSLDALQVMSTLLGNSFNLNPAIISAIEAEMAETPTSGESRVARLKMSDELFQMLRNNKKRLREEKAKCDDADPEEIEYLQGQQREIRAVIEKDAEERVEEEAQEKLFGTWRRGRKVEEQKE